VLDRVGNVVQAPLTFKAEELGGVFSIHPRSHLLRRFLEFGYYEPHVLELYRRFIVADRDIIDVGANVGFFTVAGAKCLTTGRILAAEPTSEAFSNLNRNVQQNGVSERVVLFKGLVGATPGTGEIRSVPGKEEYSSINAIEHEAVRGEQTVVESVPMETVDSLVERHQLHPALLKVDVEGAELAVFNGAVRTIKEYRPVVISEIWQSSINADGKTGADLVQFFRAAGYIVADPNDLRAKPGVRDVGEIICLPSERYSADALK
jgi:FkbM family methyltransferase